MAILKRYGSNCYIDNGVQYCDDSSWDNWARWLVFALIVVAAFLIFFSFSCISARRRRKMGYNPYRGTGWALGRTPPGHAPAQYNREYEQPYYNNNQQPYYNNSNNGPPAYTPPPNGGYYGQGSGYGNNDVELQPPAQTYSGQYKAPDGPPPNRN